MLVGLLSQPPFRSGGTSQRLSTMENPGHTATVDQEAATVESTDEASTVPQDECTEVSPHLLTLWYPPETPGKLVDKFPTTRLRKRAQETFLMGRGQNLDVLLNDEHMPRKFAELSCKLEDEGNPKWFVKNLSEKKPVRLELNGHKVTAKFNDVKELQDGHKLKLETLTFVVKIEEGDFVAKEFELEFRASDSSVSSSGSFRRQTSSSTDSSGSITSATGLARQAYGSSPVLGQNGLHVPVGHVLPRGPIPREGPGYQQGGVYPVGGQVQVSGMHPGTGPAVVYYPAPAPGSLPGSHLSGGHAHAPGPHPQYGHHQDYYQHYPNPQGGYQGGYNGQVNAVPPQGYPQGSHGSAGACAYPGVGNYGSAGPGPYPGVANHGSGPYSGMGYHAPAGPSPHHGAANYRPGAPSPYPGVGHHGPAGSSPYPGTGNHTGPGPYPGHSGEFYSFPGGGAYPGSGPVPPGHSPAHCGPHGQQPGNQQPGIQQPGIQQPGNQQPLGTRAFSQQTPAAMPTQGVSHGEVQTGMNELLSHRHSSSSYQPSSDQSTTPKQPVAGNTPVPAGHPGGQQVSDQSLSLQYPTLFSQEHQEFPPHHQQPAGPLHGPLSMPASNNTMTPQNQYGPCAVGHYADQAAIRPAAVITQPESAVVHQFSAQQPESARLHMSGSALAVQNMSGEQPQSSLVYSVSGRQPGSSHGTIVQQATDSSHFRATTLVGTSSSLAGSSPSTGLPAAPPVSEMSGLALSNPVQVVSPFPTEVVSATPANSLHPDSYQAAPGAAADARLYASNGAASPQGAGPRSEAGIDRSGSAVDQQRRGSAPLSGGPVHAYSVGMAVPPSVHSLPHQATLPQNMNPGELPFMAGPAPSSSITDPASNGNRINLRSHERIAAPTPPSSDFSSEGSTRVQDMQALAQQALAPQAGAQQALAPQALAHQDGAQRALAQQAVAQQAVAHQALAPQAIAHQALALQALAQQAGAQQNFVNEGRQPQEDDERLLEHDELES